MSRTHHFIAKLGLLLALPALLLTACRQRPIYSHYEAVSIDDWQRDDTLHFVVAQGIEDGTYRETLGLRASTAYPFTSLSLIVRQQVLPSGATRCDTVMINIVDNDGRPLGHGTGLCQYDIPLEDIALSTGDTMFIDIRHNMKREILHGITDVGMTIEKR